MTGEVNPLYDQEASGRIPDPDDVITYMPKEQRAAIYQRIRETPPEDRTETERALLELDAMGKNVLRDAKKYYRFTIGCNILKSHLPQTKKMTRNSQAVPIGKKGTWQV